MFVSEFEPRTWTRGGIAGLVLGAALLWPSFSAFRTMKAAVNWPTVEGRMNDVEVRRTDADDFIAKVNYSYIVGERTFPGTVVSLGKRIGFPSPAEAIRSVPGMGAMVRVHYDPADPASGVLQVSENPGWPMTTIAKWGLGLVGLGVLGLVMSRLVEPPRWYP